MEGAKPGPASPACSPSRESGPQVGYPQCAPEAMKTTGRPEKARLQLESEKSAMNRAAGSKAEAAIRTQTPDSEGALLALTGLTAVVDELRREAKGLAGPFLWMSITKTSRGIRQCVQNQDHWGPMTTGKKVHETTRPRGFKGAGVC